MSEPVQPGTESGTGRRQFLKKAGIMTAWSVPTMQLVNMASARAQDVKTSVTATTPTTQPACVDTDVDCAVFPPQTSVDCGPLSISVAWAQQGQFGLDRFTIGDLGPWEGVQACVVFCNGDTEATSQVNVPANGGFGLGPNAPGVIVRVEFKRLLCESGPVV